MCIVCDGVMMIDEKIKILVNGERKTSAAAVPQEVPLAQILCISLNMMFAC